MFTANTRYILAALTGALLTAGSVALVSGGKSHAETKSQAHAHAGVFVVRWNVSGFDGFQSLVTFQKTGDVIADPMTLVQSVKVPATHDIGPGHGTWRYNLAKNKIVFSIVATGVTKDGYWKIDGSFPYGGSGVPSSGKVSVKGFTHLDDIVPAYSWTDGGITAEDDWESPEA